MIIDSHLHFGEVSKFYMPEKMLIESLDKYNIDLGIISNIESCEFDSDLKPVGKENGYSQIDANRKTLELVKKYPDKLKGQFWIQPYTEGFNEEVKDFIIENRNYFVGLKIHPYHSKTKITENIYKPYLDFADEYDLPVAVHTAGDENSDPYYVYEIAQKYPKVKFIMVHMGLGTDNNKAIEYIQRLDNLYGDTTWVSFQKVLEAIEKCGSNKILFGTDNPIDGVDTYEKYSEILNKAKLILTKEEQDDLFFLNAKRIFKL